MNRLNEKRRKFLRQSAAVAVTTSGIGFAGGSLASVGMAETEYWQRRVGTYFRADDAILSLQKVAATDRTTDAARPRHLRTHSISLSFVLEQGQIAHDLQCCVQLLPHELCVNRIISPEGESREFYEGILN